MDSKQTFYSEIKAYFDEFSSHLIPSDLLKEIISMVTEEVYADYKRFWKQYPKSRKRYSKLKIEDVEHPFIRYLITDFLEKKKLSEIRNYSMILFKMNNKELQEYLDRKHWYETK